jgi:hypothetical protein
MDANPFILASVVTRAIVGVTATPIAIGPRADCSLDLETRTFTGA